MAFFIYLIVFGLSIRFAAYYFARQDVARCERHKWVVQNDQMICEKCLKRPGEFQ